MRIFGTVQVASSVSSASNAHTTNGVSTAWMLHFVTDGTDPTNPIHTQFLRLRDLMIEKGAKWPPDSPEQVREQMRARGEISATPGQTN